MAKSTIQVHIEEDIKKRADALFKELGLTMTDAINIYLRQCIFQRGIPFEIKLPDNWTPSVEWTDDPVENIF